MKKYAILADQVLTDFTRKSTDPTDSLVKIAKDHNLNAQEIERVTNKANRKIAVYLTKRAAQGEVDPHFTFPTIKTANVIMALKPSERAKPSLPTRTPDISRVFTFDSSEAPRSAVNDDPLALADNPRELEAPSKEVALRALQILRSRAQNVQQKMRHAQLMIETLMCKFTKEANQHLLQGAPLSVLKKLPIEDEELDKIAHHLVHFGGTKGPEHEKTAKYTRFNNYSSFKVNEDPSDDYEINCAHPLYKMAQDMVLYREDLEELQSELRSLETDMKILRNKK